MRIEIDSVLIFLKTNTRKQKKIRSIYSGEKILFLFFKLAPPVRRQDQVIYCFVLFYFQFIFIFLLLFLFVCAIQLLLPLLWSFCFLIFHHPFMRAVKVQRSNRQLTWDSCANSHSSLLTYHHYNTYHPDHCRMPALKIQKASPQKSLRNVSRFFLLTYSLLLFLLLPPPPSPLLSLILLPFQALKPFQFYGCYTFS